MLPALNAEGKDLRTVSAELKGIVSNGNVTIRQAAHLHGLCSGLKICCFTIEGDSGDYLGALNDGAVIRITGSAGLYLGDNMTRGTILVEGDAGYGAGAYCYGGTIVVKGNAGDFAAVMNKGATILVQGSVGDEVATYMLAGDLVIVGDAGKNLGNYLIRGNIYIAGKWESLGHNTRLEEMTQDDIAKLHSCLAEYGIKADPAAFRKIGRLSEKPFYKAKQQAQRELAHA
jgi:methylamine---glutamate N-methyltransferase subunit B